MHSLAQPGTGGTVQISGTGILFTPFADYCTTLPVASTYRARDTANAVSGSGGINITNITCVNDAPRSASISYSMTGNVVISSGTILSGGTLTGYIATSNTLIRTLGATDPEGDTISFSASVLPTHGTGVLSST